MNFTPPAASASAREHADWLEAAAVKSESASASMESLVSEFRRSGSVDGVREGRDDHGSEISQQIANDAFSELEKRQVACNGHYPFKVTQGLLTLTAEPEKSVYVLLLLLSSVAPTSGHKGTAALFERICTCAAREYFGGSQSGVDAWRFGSPRRAPYVKFHEAIDHLCVKVGEGGGCAQAQKAKHKGDGGLDIVAWKQFPDCRPGKLIAFGQCAGGARWEIKATELDGADFAKKWLREGFAVDPIRMFFLPRWLESEYWRETAVDAGIIFDRGRIAAFSGGQDIQLMSEGERVAAKLLKELRET